MLDDGMKVLSQDLTKALDKSTRKTACGKVVTCQRYEKDIEDWGRRTDTTSFNFNAAFEQKGRS